MKARCAVSAIAALTLALGAGPASAQGTPGSPARAAGASKPGQERPHRVSRIIGMDVVNRQGEKVGDIEDIVLDRQGNAAYAIVSTGGYLGIGEKLHAVPWRSLQPGAGADGFLLDVDRDRLGRAPGFDANSFPDLNDPKWSAENRRHFPVAGAERGTSTVGRDTGPTPPVKTTADPRDRPAGTSTGRAAGNDIGPRGPTTGRSGNAAGAGPADGSNSTAASGAGAVTGNPATSSPGAPAPGSGSAAGIGPAPAPGTSTNAGNPPPGGATPGATK